MSPLDDPSGGADLFLRGISREKGPFGFDDPFAAKQRYSESESKSIGVESESGN